MTWQPQFKIPILCTVFAFSKHVKGQIYSRTHARRTLKLKIKLGAERDDSLVFLDYQTIELLHFIQG